jgi:hypothetical protein
MKICLMGIILLGVILTSYLSYLTWQSRMRAKVTQTSLILRSHAAASISFHERLGYWPTAVKDLTNNPTMLKFIDMSPDDAWGNGLEYIPFSTNLGYGIVRSLGRDGKSGGASYNADLEVKFGAEER